MLSFCASGVSRADLAALDPVLLLTRVASYRELGQDLMLMLIYPLFFFFFFSEKCEGGNPVEADQLLPAMEEEVLQAPGKDPLLRQRLQGA